MFQVSPEAAAKASNFSLASKKSDKTNIELGEQTEIADQYSILGSFDSDEKPSERVILDEQKDKDSFTLLQPNNEVDTSMPTWPTYNDPVS